MSTQMAHTYTSPYQLVQSTGLIFTTLNIQPLPVGTVHWAVGKADLYHHISLWTVLLLVMSQKGRFKNAFNGYSTSHLVLIEAC